MPLAFIGPLGGTEVLVILLVALMLFGGRLPEVARSIGRSVNQFKRGLRDLDDELRRAESEPRTKPPALPAARSEPAGAPGTAGPADAADTAARGPAGEEARSASAVPPVREPRGPGDPPEPGRHEPPPSSDLER